MQSSGMVGRVKQEVAIHSKLKHPSILELYTFFEDENYVYLVLELAQHGELHRYLKESQRVSNLVLFVFCFGIDKFTIFIVINRSHFSTGIIRNGDGICSDASCEWPTLFESK